MASRRLRIAPIVEGDGEVHSARVLLERIGLERLGLEYVEVLRPLRRRRNRLVRNIGNELSTAITAAARQLLAPTTPSPDPILILVLVDADDDCASEIASELRRVAHDVRSDICTACVVAVKEYETWFVASADSLREFLDLAENEPPIDPESQRCGKAWIEKRFRGSNYRETLDQPKLTARIDLQICRDRCRSFDKLCREMEKAAGLPST